MGGKLSYFQHFWRYPRATCSPPSPTRPWSPARPQPLPCRLLLGDTHVVFHELRPLGLQAHGGLFALGTNEFATPVALCDHLFLHGLAGVRFRDHVENLKAFHNKTPPIEVLLELGLQVGVNPML